MIVDNLLTIVKGTRVSEQQTFEEDFVIRRSSMASCGSVDVDIVAYRGPLTRPDWMDIETGKDCYSQTILQ